MAKTFHISANNFAIPGEINILVFVYGKMNLNPALSVRPH